MLNLIMPLLENSVEPNGLLLLFKYGPFGEVIRATGPIAKLNPKRFQTVTADDETDLLYYGYRYYNPSTERWLNRDPIEEKGGANLYGFVFNNPVNYGDVLGLKQVLIWASAYIREKTFWFLFWNGGDPTAIYSGDGRPGPQIGGSSRAYHLLTIETDPSKPAVVRNTSGGGISQVWYAPGGGPIKYLYLSAVDLAPPLATVTRNGSLTIVTLHEASSDPLVLHAPDIIYDYALVFASCGKLHAFGNHTHFPAFDIVIDSTSGQKFVENYRPTSINNTPAALFFRPLIWFDSGLIDY